MLEHLQDLRYTDLNLRVRRLKLFRLNVEGLGSYLGRKTPPFRIKLWIDGSGTDTF